MCEESETSPSSGSKRGNPDSKPSLVGLSGAARARAQRDRLKSQVGDLRDKCKDQALELKGLKDKFRKWRSKRPEAIGCGKCAT